MTTTSTAKRARKGAAPAPKRGWLVPAIVGVLVLVLGVVAIAATRGGGDAAGAVEVAPVTATGTPLPSHSEQIQAGAPDPAIGQTAPSLAGVSFDGTPVTVQPGDGSARLLVFLAHWCPHCQKEVTSLVQWQKAGGTMPGVQITAVSTAVVPARGNYPPSSWLGREGWSWPVMVDDENGTAAQAYGLASFPYIVLVKPDGTVGYRHAGEIPPNQLAEQVARALGTSS